MKRASFVAMACVLACSSQDTTSDGGTDASIDADATADAPQETGEASTDGGPSACNALTNVGALVAQTYVATDPVTGDGGTIAPGTYALTAAVVYTGADGGAGPTGTSLEDTIAIDDAGLYQRVASIVNDAGLDGSPIHQNGDVVVNGATIQVNETCPPGTQPFTSYDSNGTKLHVYAPPSGNNPAVMFEYTKP
jgi:hypothetical protein